MSGMETYLGGSPMVAVGAAFAGGVLAGFSPCVYPMLPIVSAFVGSRTGGEKSRLNSFTLSLAYVVGMAAVYSLLGMVAALTGSMFGLISTSPWALLIVANFLILFALNILEVFCFRPGFQDESGNRPRLACPARFCSAPHLVWWLLPARRRYSWVC